PSTPAPVRKTPPTPPPGSLFATNDSRGLQRPVAQSSPALPPPERVIFSDSFHRADGDMWNLGHSDRTFGGRESSYYILIFGGRKPAGSVIRANALENNGYDFGGIQFAATSGTNRGAIIGQDMNIRVDLLVPTDAARNITQAGPYFRSRCAATGDGVIGGTSAGYWVMLDST